MKLLRRQFQEGLRLCAGLLVGLLFAGCSHLYYADPNPPNPFAFPGQSSPPAVAKQAPLSPVGTPVAPANPRAPSPPATPPAASSPAPGGTDILAISDSITVSFSDIPPPGLLPVTQRIGDDGQITLPYNVKVVAAGKTVEQLQNDIRNAYVPKYFVHMTPSVNSEERVFFVEGEVKQPSRLPYKGEMTVLRAITSAGGFTDFAKRTNIEVRRTGGQKSIRVNWFKATKDPRLDPKVYPNDQIIVHKRIL